LLRIKQQLPLLSDLIHQLIMSFSISQIIVCDTTNKVVALNWSYENADGKLSNQWTLEKPYGDLPLASCTEAVLLGFLMEQLPNTSSEFDMQIAAAKEQAEFEQTLQEFIPHSDGPPTPMPVPDEEIENANPA
jgi:hypothetical protein